MAAGIAAGLLDDEEQVHCVVQGRIRSDTTLAVLTGGRLLVCSDLLWDPAADLDDNNIVNGLDLTEVISNWTVASAAAAPEAATTSESQVAEKSGRGRGNAKRGPGNVKGKK